MSRDIGAPIRGDMPDPEIAKRPAGAGGLRAHRRDMAADSHYSVSSTCYSQGTITASGRRVFVGEVASNELALGTRIRLDHMVFGRRDYVVLDRIGWGTQLDIYNPSNAACTIYGRRQIGFVVLRR